MLPDDPPFLYEKKLQQNVLGVLEFYKKSFKFADRDERLCLKDFVILLTIINLAK